MYPTTRIVIIIIMKDGRRRNSIETVGDSNIRIKIKELDISNTKIQFLALSRS